MLADAVVRHRPDVVVVDMTRPDRDALEGVRQLSRTTPHPVVMFVDRDDPGFMEAAIDAGVSSYNVGSVSAGEMKPCCGQRSRCSAAINRHMPSSPRPKPG